MVTSDPIPPTETQAVALAHEAEIGPLIGIIVGSQSDLEHIEPAQTILRDAGVPIETTVMSSHREPEKVASYCKGARGRGLRVIIAGAGLAASLPGVAAAHTDLPVIGLPLTSRLTVAGGLDALLSMAQMPPGVPVATVGVDNAKNAAHLALRILSI
ncbi:MAG: 5-(carboxyamino)imidazole ribonucleotide mutase [Solirubrobacteraceae bacterium]|nr:5-(carboxyamino)imidazole ribonucleotide mutase [Patulibacter sp.]